MNVGATTQAKAGNLSVNILAATSQIRANAYCNAVGTACPLQVMPSGFVTIASAAPTIYMQDSDHTDFFMHVNSNIWYLLADRNGDGTWTAELPGPLTIGAGPTPASDYVRTEQFRANQYCDALGQNCFGAADAAGLPDCAVGQVLMVNSDNTWACGTVSGPGKKTDAQCTAAGGTPITAGDARICRFNGASCPSGWQQHQNWSTYTTQQCGNSCGLQCMTGGLAWNNNSGAIPQCLGYMGKQSQGECDQGNAVICTAARTQIGCY